MFVNALNAAHKVEKIDSIDEWPVLAPLEDIVNHNEFRGSQSKLLDQLIKRAGRGANHKSFPTNARALGRQLNDNEAVLLEKGIIVEDLPRTKDERGIRIYRKDAPKDESKLPADAKACMEAVEKNPDALVYMNFTDGSVCIFGKCAEQAADMVCRTADPRGIIRLKQEEWELVIPELKYTFRITPSM